MFKLPKNWVVYWNKARWKKPYGHCFIRGRIIEVYPPKWIPPIFGLRKYFAGIIFDHEAMHAWGNPGCQHPWCLGYEGKNWKEYLAMPIQLLAGLTFCKDCKAFYKGE